MPPAEAEWETVDRSLVHDGRVVLYDHTIILPDGSRAHYEVDTSVPFAAAVLVVKANEVLVARQYRYPIDRWIFDLPAGSAEPGEQPIDTARRELEEEAGIIPVQLTLLHTFFPNPGRASWPVHLFLCADGTTVGDVNRDDPAEQVETAWLHIEELDALLADGHLVDPALIIARTMAARRGVLPPIAP